MTRRFLHRCLLGPLLAGSCLHAQALLDFGDGNFIRGKALELRDGSLRWRHALSGGEMEFPAEKIQRLLFSGNSAPIPSGDILLLDNGDVLSGTIQSLDESALVILSPVLGDIKLDRKRLRTARLAPRAGSIVFRDDGELANWTLAEKSQPVEWTSENGVLHYRGRGQGQTLARDVRLPPSADVSFEVAWDKEREEETGFGAYFSLLLGADGAEGKGSDGFYKIMFGRSMVTLERSYGADSARSPNVVGRLQFHKLRGIDHMARVRVILDRPRKKIHVLINGQEIGQATDDSPDEPTGTWIGFQPNRQGNFRVRRLRVDEWNGFLGNKLATTKKSATSSDLVITAPDGDEIFGNIKSIREEPGRGRVVETAVVVNQSKPMVIPVSRIAHLAFASSGKAVPAADPSTALLLDDGSKVAIKLLGLDEEVLHADVYGRADVRIPLGHVLSIEFPRANGKQAAEQDQNPPEPEE